MCLNSVFESYEKPKDVSGIGYKILFTNGRVYYPALCNSEGRGHLKGTLITRSWMRESGFFGSDGFIRHLWGGKDGLYPIGFHILESKQDCLDYWDAQFELVGDEYWEGFYYAICKVEWHGLLARGLQTTLSSNSTYKVPCLVARQMRILEEIPHV